MKLTDLLFRSRRTKRRKRLRVKIIYTRHPDDPPSDEDESPPPPPPPGSPPLHSTAYIMKHFAWQLPPMGVAK